MTTDDGGTAIGQAADLIAAAGQSRRGRPRIR